MNKFKKLKLNILLVILIPIAFYISGLLTLSDYGINWDEPYHYRRGHAYLHYYLTGEKTYNQLPKYPSLKGETDSIGFRGSDENFIAVQNNPSLSDPTFRRSYYQDDSWNGEYFIDIEDPYGHPALPSILAAISNLIFYQKLNLLGEIESYHLFQVSLSGLTVLVMGIFMYKKFGLFASIVSSLAISTYPLLVAERHFNIKDPVEMSFYTLTMLSFYIAVTEKKKHWLITSVIMAGLALSTKFNILFATIPLTIWVTVLIKSRLVNIKELLRKFYPILLTAPILVFGMVIIFFPSLWKDPLHGLLRIFLYYKEVGYDQSQPDSYYLLNGNLNTFPILWILFTTPIVTLLLCFSNLFFYKNIFDKKNHLMGLLLFLWMFTAIIRISLFGALSYGGVRIIMEFIPALSMLAGIGAFNLGKKYGEVIKFMILVLYIPVIYILFLHHPHENVYFNSLIGGLQGAKERNFNSWGNTNGNGYFEGLKWINDNVEENALLTVPVGSTSNIPRFILRKDIAVSRNYWSGSENKGEYVIELTYDYKPMEWYSLKYLNTVLKPVYEVTVDGVAVAKVWKNDSKYVHDYYKNTKTVPASITKTNNENGIRLSLDREYEIMDISINIPTIACKPIKTGYIETSKDGISWVRETEDISQNQIKHHLPKELSNTFKHYFVAQKAKYIHIYFSNDSCLLQAKEATVTVLNHF